MVQKPAEKCKRQLDGFIVIETRRERREPREKRARPNAKNASATEKSNPSRGSDLLRVEGLSDQNGQRWLHVKKGVSSALVGKQAYFARGSNFWQVLADQGLSLTRSSSRLIVSNAIEDIQEWPQKVYVADRPGYHCGAIVKPDGTVIGEPKAPHFHVDLPAPKLALTKQGSLDSWQAMVRTFAQGQVAYTTLLGAAFVGPLLELFPGADNVCLWFAGETSGGKSTGLDLYCSVWGAPHQQAGSLGVSLRSTSVGLEQHMMARAAASFAADDVNHLGRTDREKDERIYDLTFMVSHGVEKERFNDPARRRVQQSFLATANTALAGHLRGQDPGNAEAVLARFLTVTSGAPGLGVFDRLPEGYADSYAAITDLQVALIENHGYAADAFLSKLASARRSDEAALKARLEKYRDWFIKWAQVDADDRAGARRARSAAMIYVAARLAREWGILPLRGLKSTLLEIHRRSVAAAASSALVAPQSAQELVQAYVRTNLAKLRDLDARRPKRMSRKKLDRHPGLLKTLKHRRYLLIRSARWDGEFGAASHRLLKELQAEGSLHATDGLQAQVRVRANSTKARVYCVALG